MPPNTFEAEIFSFPHTYTKLTFGTAGIKKLDKVISTYKIPDGEQIIAYMKGTVFFNGRCRATVDRNRCLCGGNIAYGFSYLVRKCGCGVQ